MAFTPILYEGENATLTGSCVVMTDHTGYSGTGFVGQFNTLSSAMTFTVNVSATGSKNIIIRYAAGAGGARLASIYVNSAKIKQESFPATANWDTWADLAESLTLNAGSNTIKMQYDSGDTGSVNVDYITVADSSNIYSLTGSIDGASSISSNLNQIRKVSTTVSGLIGVSVVNLLTRIATASVNNITSASTTGFVLRTATGLIGSMANVSAVSIAQRMVTAYVSASSDIFFKNSILNIITANSNGSSAVNQASLSAISVAGEVIGNAIINSESEFFLTAIGYSDGVSTGDSAVLYTALPTVIIAGKSSALSLVDARVSSIIIGIIRLKGRRV